MHTWSVYANWHDYDEPVWIPFWIYDCAWCCRWGSHLWCMVDQHFQFCELCFNSLLEHLLHSCNHSDRFWHSVVNHVCDALEIILVQYCLKCWSWTFPFLSRWTSHICCAWSFFTNWCFAFICFFFVFLWRSLLLCSFAFLVLFFFSFFFFWLIFDNLFYIFLRHSIVTNMPITTLLCTRLQIDMMSIYCEVHYPSLCVIHLMSNSRATVDSFTQLAIVVIEHHVISVLPRSIWCDP